MSADFWNLAGEFMASDDRLVEGSIMGQPCLRLDNEFVAMPEHKADRLIVKLEAERVSELIDAGIAAPFAPAGKVFREWAAISDQEHWSKMLAEGIAKAAASAD